MWSCRSLLSQPSLPNCRHPKKLQASPCSLSQGQALYTAPILALGGGEGDGTGKAGIEALPWATRLCPLSPSPPVAHSWIVGVPKQLVMSKCHWSPPQMVC